MNMLRVIKDNCGVLYIYLNDQPLEIIAFSDVPASGIRAILDGAEAILKSQGDFETHCYGYDGQEFEFAMKNADTEILFNLFPEFWQLEELGEIVEVECWF